MDVATDPFLVSADGNETLLTAPVTGSQTVYDGHGRAKETRRLHGVDIALSNGETTLVSAGTLVATTQTVYDEKGRTAKTINAAGRQTEYEYGAQGRRVATIDHPVTIDGVTVRHRAETEYDQYGNVAREISGIRQLEDGTLDRSDERITEFGYDEQGRQVKATMAVGTALEQSVQTRYDVFGRVEAEINQHGLEKTFEYDARGQLAAVLLPAVPDPNSNSVLTRPRYEYRYDARGKIQTIRDPLYGHANADPTSERETSFTYDERGNQLTRTMPDGTSETFEYDEMGRQTLHVSFEGVVTQFVYDDSIGAGGRLAEQKFFDNLTAYNAHMADPLNVHPSERRVHIYDAFGREVQVTHHRKDGTQDVWSTEYDADGRVIRIVSPQGAVNYEYDPATGDRTRTFTGENASYAADQADPVNDFRYTYDALGRLDTVEVYERNDVTQ